MARAWNLGGSQPKIEGIYQKKKNELYLDLKSRLTECDNEWCWITHPKIAPKVKGDNEVLFSFGAPMPPGQYDWLWTSDLNIVGQMIQYFHPHFAYLGAHPINFEKFEKNKFGAKFNVTKYQKRGITQLGLILNTDPSTEKGKHWIALAVDIPLKRVFFFDSVGMSAPKEVKVWVDKKFKGYIFTENRNQHQFKSSECGVYALHFLDKIASGVPFGKISSKIIKDEQMNQKRKKYFNEFTPRQA